MTAIPYTGSALRVEAGIRFEPARVVQASYALVDAADLIPSHRWDTLQPDRRYPSGLQGRAYSGQYGRTAAAMVATQVLEPMYVLDPTRFPWGGPPICTSRGLVIAGNHRAILLQRAALGNAEREITTYAEYRGELFETARAWGFDAAAVQSIAVPVLVRMLDDREWTWRTEDDRDAFFRLLNVLSDRPPTKAYDVLSDGFAMATSLLETRTEQRRDALATLAEIFAASSMDAVLRGASGYSLISVLTKYGAITVAEHSALVDPIAERLSSGGRSRIAWMVRALVVGDRHILASAPRGVLKRLGSCWAPLLSAVCAPGGRVIRDRLREALELLALRAEHAGDVGDYAIVESSLCDAASSCSVLLAQCLSALPQKDLAEFVARWIATLAEEEPQPMFAGFDAAPQRGLAAERAVLDDWNERATRAAARCGGQRVPEPEAYLSATEWAILEPLFPTPTLRRSASAFGGRPAHSNRALAAGLVYAFELGATPRTLVRTWGKLPRAWIKKNLVCRRTTLQRRLARLDSITDGRRVLLGMVAQLAAARSGRGWTPTRNPAERV